ncbi:MAG: hypothetical protein E7631_04985 [Ruminococcaceae bacterium]|nr:hypothetical protein [Oscillospiraceae bacterium]
MMLPLLLGCTGFVLFLLYDINSITVKNRWLEKFFFAGLVLICISTVLTLLDALRLAAFGGIADTVYICLSILSFAALLYCLFFALPFDETYIVPEEKRCVYDKGVYAFCRHPGVLCFFAMYLFLGLAAMPSSSLLFCGMIFSLLNFAYVCFQDAVTFPRTFVDYHEYKKHVPFIIPTPASIRAGCKTFSRSNRKEGSK